MVSKISLLLRTFPKRKLLTFGIILTILSSILTLFFSYLLKLLIDASINKNLELFFKILYIVIIAIIFELIFVFLKTKLLGTYTEGGINKLRNDIAKKITLMDYDKLSKSHSGDITSIATNDLSKIRSFTSTTLPDIIRVPLTAIGAFIFLLILSWKLTLISLAIIPILIIGSNLLSKPIGPISKKLQEKLGTVNTYSTDFIKGIEVSKSYNLENVIYNKYQSSVNETVEYGKELAKKRAILESFSNLLSITPFIITFLLGGYFVIKGQMTIGALLAFINLLNHLTFPLSQLPILASEAINDLVSLGRILSIIEAKEERNDGESLDFNINNPIIEFKNVSFSYPDEEENTIDDLNLIINHLDSVAFVGPSGGGKSTIIKLILGYYDNYNGEIFIGGHELRTWNLNKLRSYLSLVTQDTFLFPETIEENISYGNSNANIEDIINSTKASNADDFVKKLKDGYQTKIGELGNTLSGGQKQRLAISRAVLKDTPILVLDEPTSALDNESEKLVQDALDKILINKTSIIVAHRLSTIKNVNKIFVLKNGRLVEEGNHEELFKLNGVYKELYKKQMETEVKNDEE